MEIVGKESVMAARMVAGKAGFDPVGVIVCLADAKGRQYVCWEASDAELLYAVLDEVQGDLEGESDGEGDGGEVSDE